MLELDQKYKKSDSNFQLTISGYKSENIQVSEFVIKTIS